MPSVGRVSALRTNLPGVAFGLPLATGRFYCNPFATTTQLVTASSGQIVAVPMPIYAPVTIDEMGVEVTTGAASGLARFGIYYDDGGWPGRLKKDGGSVATATNGVFASVTGMAAKLYPGWWWAVAFFYGASPTVRGQNAIMTQFGIGNGNTSFGYAFGGTGWPQSFGTAGLPRWFMRHGGFGNTFEFSAALPRLMWKV